MITGKKHGHRPLVFTKTKREDVPAPVREPKRLLYSREPKPLLFSFPQTLVVGVCVLIGVMRFPDQAGFRPTLGYNKPMQHGGVFFTATNEIRPQASHSSACT